MKNKLKLAIIAAFLAVGAVGVLTHSTPAAFAATGDATSPRTMYIQNCARCHGSNGKAETTLGKKLDAKDISGHISTAKVIRTVTNGKGDMPSFRKRLSAAQIKSIAGYVHSSL